MKQVNLVAFMAGLALLMHGCTSSAQTAKVTPSRTSAQLTASRSNLNFGNIIVGKNRSRDVTLTNSGNSSVTISNISISGPGFNATGMSGSILSPGQSVSLPVAFAPSGTGSVSGTVTITSSAANSPTKINLSGACVPTVSSISVIPADQNILVGSQLQFTAMDDLGNDITSSVTWSSSDPSVVSITADGLATGLADGEATIEATI